MKVKITERGWAAHHICRDRCLFHRNTLIEYGDKKWIVSTVGNLRVNKKWDSVGHERWYETKAWQTKEEDGYLEIDVFNPIDFNSDCGLYAKTVEELFEKYPCPDNVANDMHDAVVVELAEKIKQ